MLTIFKSGFKDTFRAHGGWGWVIGVALTGPLAVLFTWYLLEDVNLSDEIWKWAIVVVGPGLASFAIMLLVNICAAPYRLERDAHTKTISEAAQLKATVARLESLPQPRRLTEEQKSSIADSLRETGIKPDFINVIYWKSSDECADLAEDIGTILGKARLLFNVHDGNIFNHDPKERGVKILFPDTPELNEFFGVLRDSLIGLGIDAERRKLDPDSKDGSLVYVARASKRESLLN